MRDGLSLEQSGCSRDALLCMRTGLRGGVKPPTVPGSWTCSTCNLGGRWLARNTCFRRRQPREKQALGRAPQRSPAVDPAQRDAHARRRLAPRPLVYLASFRHARLATLTRRRCQVAKSPQPPCGQESFFSSTAGGSVQSATAHCSGARCATG